MRITQSFIKTMRDYISGNECGRVVEHQYKDGKLIDKQSKEMAEGSYFEFLLTGALPKNKMIPKPVYMATPLKNKKPSDLKVSDMNVDYRRAHVNAERVKKMLQDDLGLKFIKVGHTLTKGRYEGTIDIICECTKEITFDNGVEWKIGDIIVVDVKYSGLLYNKWEKFGWEWSDIQKEYHGTQAKQYHYITGAPFYFLVVSNTNKEVDGEFEPTEMKIFYVPIDEHQIQEHINEGNKLKDRLEKESVLGLTPRPSYIRCQKCEIASECDLKHTYVHPEIVDLTIGV